MTTKATTHQERSFLGIDVRPERLDQYFLQNLVKQIDKLEETYVSGIVRGAAEVEIQDANGDLRGVLIFDPETEIWSFQTYVTGH